MEVDEARIRFLNRQTLAKGNIALWMNRDQRVEDNWSLLFAQQLVKESGSTLLVFFTLNPCCSGANLRHYHFMFNGLQEVEAKFKELNIPFIITIGNPVNEIISIVQEYNIGILVSDFDPLRTNQQWKSKLRDLLSIPLVEVDSHNIIPCWKVSNKEEYAASTIRPKIKSLLPRFLTEFIKVERQSNNPIGLKTIDWKEVLSQISFNESVKPVGFYKPGSKVAFSTLFRFINDKLCSYHKRNDPTENVLSELSPYLHYGQIAAQRVAIEVEKVGGSHSEEGKAFLEELIVRRELSDNFCYYNSNYDSITGFRSWAKTTLQDHTRDEREFLYSKDQFEKAETHDPLWNAAQNEMKIKGKMHGYMRMYWAKKILEWTTDPQTALEYAIYLNDKYSLDGRDPNAYVGCAWSIGGIHDRAWQERPVFGKIRYMNYNGCKRKFDVERYIRNIDQIRLDKFF